MRTVTLPLPVVGFVIATRAALAAGIGLLLAERFTREQRRKVGGTLVAVGAATTIPAAWWVSRSLRRRRLAGSGIASDRRLIGATRFSRKGDDEF